MRYFRTADAELYDSVRLQLDAAWGHPTADGQTITCVEPSASAPRDHAGRILLALRDEFLDIDEVSATLPSLLQSGAIEEIGEAEYVSPPPAP